MLLAERRLLAALEIEGRALRTGICCTFEAEVNHGIPGMIPAERRRPATHAVENCFAPARFVQALLAADVEAHHAALSVLFAEGWPLAALKIETRRPHAGIMCTTPAVDGYHALLGMFRAEHGRLSAFDIPGWRNHARIM